jgi:putative membrane protein
MTIRLTRTVALVGASALLAACSKTDNKADSTVAADTAAKANAAATPAPPTAAALTDANIFALLDEANSTDSAGGSMAATKGTNATVKSFGRDMMRDHHKLRADGQALAQKLNVTPAPPAGDSIPAMVQKTTDKLTSTPKGADWDKAYIDGEVATHQYVQSLLQTAAAAAQDSSLKKAITAAQPVVDAHLKKAQSIQAKLNGAKA